MKSKASGEVLVGARRDRRRRQEERAARQIDKRTPQQQGFRDRRPRSRRRRRAAAIAKTQLDRAKQLFKSQTLTQTDVEKAQLEFANAQAQVVSAQVALENAQITLDDTDVRAPVTGTILEKSVEPGTVIASTTTQNVSGGTTLMKMADLTSVQVRTRVDETDIGKIQPGMADRVTVAAYPNQPFDGVVLKVEPQAVVEQNVTMFSVLIKLAQPRRRAQARHERGRADQDRESRLCGGRADGRAARGHRRAGRPRRCSASTRRSCASRFGPTGTPAAGAAQGQTPFARRPRDHAASPTSTRPQFRR